MLGGLRTLGGADETEAAFSAGSSSLTRLTLLLPFSPFGPSHGPSSLFSRFLLFFFSSAPPKNLIVDDSFSIPSEITSHIEPEFPSPNEKWPTHRESGFSGNLHASIFWMLGKGLANLVC